MLKSSSKHVKQMMFGPGRRRVAKMCGARGLSSNVAEKYTVGKFSLDSLRPIWLDFCTHIV